MIDRQQEIAVVQLNRLRTDHVPLLKR
jgi:hypothetical protein